MSFYYTLTNERKHLESKIINIKEKLETLPKENLRCARNKNSYKWYSYSDNSRKYIYKKDRTYAEKLALKKYYLLALEDCTQELKAINACLKHFPDHKKSDLLIQQESEYKNLLSNHFKPINPDFEKWASEPYDTNNSHPESLKFKTAGGYFVRSKSELIIDNLLSINKLPFRYECALNLNSIVLYPDFTIKHPKTGILFYWEHFGLIDNPSYANSATSKLHSYISNGIYPNINLITTYETKENPLDTNMIEKIIKYYFL